MPINSTKNLTTYSGCSNQFSMNKTLSILRTNSPLNSLPSEVPINILITIFENISTCLKNITITKDAALNILETISLMRNKYACSNPIVKNKPLSFNCSVTQADLPKLISSSIEVTGYAINANKPASIPLDNRVYEYLLNDIPNLFTIFKHLMDNGYEADAIFETQRKLIALVNGTQENFSRGEVSALMRSFSENFSPKKNIYETCMSIFNNPCNLTNLETTITSDIDTHHNDSATPIQNHNVLPSAVAAAVGHGVASGLINFIAQAASMYLRSKGFGKSKASRALLSLTGAIFQAGYLATWPLVLFQLNKLMAEGNEGEAQKLWNTMVQEEMLPTFLTGLSLSAALQFLNYISPNYLSKNPTAKAGIQSISVFTTMISAVKNPVPTIINVGVASTVSATCSTVFNQFFRREQQREQSFDLTLSGELFTNTSEATTSLKSCTTTAGSSSLPSSSDEEANPLTTTHIYECLKSPSIQTRPLPGTPQTDDPALGSIYLKMHAPSSKEVDLLTSLSIKNLDLGGNTYSNKETFVASPTNGVCLCPKGNPISISEPLPAGSSTGCYDVPPAPHPIVSFTHLIPKSSEKAPRNANSYTEPSPLSASH